MPLKIVSLVLCTWCFISGAWAHGPLPVSLKGAPLPPLPPGLIDGDDPMIVDPQTAIVLGKALFWDMAVGSDGVACASCHFHAGADNRAKNQLNPGEKNPASSGMTFEPTASGGGGPNYTLRTSDFPFHQRQNPFDGDSAVTFDSDDVVSSSGTFSGSFNGATRRGRITDDCSRDPDPLFHVGSAGTRRVEPRNSPTVINAVFNHRNFWDGRASNSFNGSSQWGDRDPDAGVWVKVDGRHAIKRRVSLVNSSLASQALAPPLNATEMSCQDRNFADLARKLLNRHPLAKQKVHYQDSVLGAISYSSEDNLKSGLNTTYAKLVKQTFNRKYWGYFRRGSFGGPPGKRPYSQMEANFGLFFGLAIQMYESTLISDDSPFDNAEFDDQGLPTNLGESVRNGIIVFEDLHCNICHSGPAMTANAVLTNALMLENDSQAFGPNTSNSGTDGVAINRNLVNYDNANGSKLFDTGFANTGVQDPFQDPGVNGLDDFGNPLSYAAQYAEYLAGTPNAIIDTSAGIEQTKSCNFQSPLASDKFIPPFITVTQFFRPDDGILADPNGNENCFGLSADAFIPSPATAAAELADPDSAKMAFATQAAFKIPTLRNVELTAPYMHNGSMATLEQVIEFYARGGNFNNDFTHEFVFENGLIAGNDPEQNAIPIQKRADLIAFLKSLTDERVRYEKAPFDHPQLIITNGHKGNALMTDAPHWLDASLAEDDVIVLEAVGAEGRTTPLPTFEENLAP